MGIFQPSLQPIDNDSIACIQIGTTLCVCVCVYDRLRNLVREIYLKHESNHLFKSKNQIKHIIFAWLTGEIIKRICKRVKINKSILSVALYLFLSWKYQWNCIAAKGIGKKDMLEIKLIIIYIKKNHRWNTNPESNFN